MYRKLKGKHPGELWIALARMAIEQAQAGAAESPDIDLEELDSKGQIQ